MRTRMRARRRPWRARLSAALASIASVCLLAACAPATSTDSSATPADTGPVTDAALVSTSAPPVPAEKPSSGPDVLRNLDYVGEGNHAQTLDLYLPTTRTHQGPVPLVIFVHGGAWFEGSKEALDDRKAGSIVALVDLLRANGYAVAGINYRLSGEATWPAQIFDVKAATRYLRANAAQLGLHPAKFAIAGESAGAQLALMVGLTSGVEDLEGTLGNTSASSRVSTMISYYGVTDLRTLPVDRQRANCPPQSMPGAQTLEGKMLGVEPSSRAGALLGAQASPIMWVNANSPPLLLMHGRQDCAVPDVQSERMQDDMVAAGASSTLHLIDANHAWPVFYTDPTLQQAVLAHLKAAFAR